MMESIIQSEKKCFICGQAREYGFDRLEIHHIFPGNPNRKNSDKYGLTVWLCGCSCHREGPMSVHKNRKVDLALKCIAQQKFEETHSREEFRKIFGRSYL